MKSGIWALMSLLFPLTFGLPQCLAQSVKDQTKTYCEDDGPGTFSLDADSLPKAVVDSVLNASESKQMLAGESRAEVSPEKLLHAKRIRPSSDGATEFLVIGSPPLSAADGSWFWIVRDEGAKASVLLWTAGSCVALEGSRTRGYRDVEILWASAGTEQKGTYRYDGKVYKLAHSRMRARGPHD
jgi:hypothetical protein